MLPTENIRPSLPDFYQSFFVPTIFEPWAEVLLDEAMPCPGERVLDLACGTGIVARKAAARVAPRGNVTGIDLRPGMLEVAAAQGGSNIDWRQGDAASLPLEDETCDLVLCQAGLQYFSERDLAVAEMHRVLRRGGRLALSTWQGLERHPIFARLAEIEFRHLGMLGLSEEEVTAPFLMGDPEELSALIARGGFSSIEVSERALTVRFPSIAEFVPGLEYAYSAVMPQFATDPAAFESFVVAVTADARETIEQYRDGEGVSFPMYANILTAIR